MKNTRNIHLCSSSSIYRDRPNLSSTARITISSKSVTLTPASNFSRSRNFSSFFQNLSHTESRPSPRNSNHNFHFLPPAQRAKLFPGILEKEKWKNKNFNKWAIPRRSRDSKRRGIDRQTEIQSTIFFFISLPLSLSLLLLISDYRNGLRISPHSCLIFVFLPEKKITNLRDIEATRKPDNHVKWVQRRTDIPFCCTIGPGDGALNGR